MSAPGQNPEDPDDGGAGTLGDLLYGRARVPEAEWVALVGAIAAGDELALHALYQRTNRIVFTLIMRVVDDIHAAEELTLDVFHDVWRRASSFDAAGGSVIGWIMNQARSRAIDRQRFEQRKKRQKVSTAADDDDGLSELLELSEDANRLRAALIILSADERSAIETTFFNGLTHVEAAERLGQPLGTLKSRIRSALGKLRAALAEEVPQ